MHSFSFILLIFVVLAFAKSEKKEDYTSLAKSYIKKMKEKTEPAHIKAREALKEVRKEKYEKQMEALRKTKENKLKELIKKTENLSKDKLQKRIDSYEADVLIEAKKLSKETLVSVPTSAGTEARVSLLGLNRAVASDAAAVNVTSISGNTVEIPTLACRDIAISVSQRILRKAESIAQKKLMKEAQGNPAAANKLMKLLFNKIYVEEPDRARQKAFSRVERMMGLKDGLLYNQYKQGVKKPTLTPATQKPKTTNTTVTGEDLLKDDLNNNLKNANFDPNMASVLSTYQVINNMDLANNEQEIPENLLNLLNKNIRSESAKKEEEEKTTLQKVKTYLFGNF